MTIQQITEKLQKKTSTNDERLQFAVIVKASVTEMNLDLPNVISIKWFAAFFHSYRIRYLVKIEKAPSMLSCLFHLALCVKK